MRHLLCFLILLGTAACSTPTWEEVSKANESTMPLIGDWQPTEMPLGMPEACSNQAVAFHTDNTTIYRSGMQVLKADYTVEREGEGFALVQSNVTTNGEPNCQGLSAEFVLANYAHRLYIEVHGDTLRIYIGDRSHGLFYSLVRAQP